MNKDIVIVAANRTAIGNFTGALASVPASTLGATVIKALLDKTAINPANVDEVIMGHVLTAGLGQNPARQASMEAGLPDTVPAMTINKVCGSGLKAIMLAADSIQLGHSQVVIAGGMENMSQAPYALPKARFGQRLGNGELIDLIVYDGLQDPYSKRHMGEITEDWIADNGFTRDEQDEYAARSYRLSQAAITNGTFNEEIVPVVVEETSSPFVISIFVLSPSDHHLNHLLLVINYSFTTTYMKHSI